MFKGILDIPTHINVNALMPKFMSVHNNQKLMIMLNTMTSMFFVCYGYVHVDLFHNVDGTGSMAIYSIIAHLFFRLIHDGAWAITSP